MGVLVVSARPRFRCPVTKIKRAGGKKLNFLIRISHAHLLLFRFPLFSTSKVSEIIRPGDESSYKNRNRRKCDEQLLLVGPGCDKLASTGKFRFDSKLNIQHTEYNEWSARFGSERIAKQLSTPQRIQLLGKAFLL